MKAVERGQAASRCRPVDQELCFRNCRGAAQIEPLAGGIFLHGDRHDIATRDKLLPIGRATQNTQVKFGEPL